MPSIIKNATEPCACGETVIRNKKFNECGKCYRLRYRAENLEEIQRKEREAARVRYVPAERSQEPRTAPTESCSYTAAHKRCARWRGSAKEFACVDCGEQGQEWSYRGGSSFVQTGLSARRKNGKTVYVNSKWSGYIWDYDARCIDCHKAYDTVV
jgi:hypothetical protein